VAGMGDTPRRISAADFVLSACPTPDVEGVVSAIMAFSLPSGPGRSSLIIPPFSDRDAQEWQGRRRKGRAVLDAPVSGAISARATPPFPSWSAGTNAFRKSPPLLSAWAKPSPCAAPPQRSTHELVNQILVSITNLASAKRHLRERKRPRTRKKTVTAVGGGAAGSWQLTTSGQNARRHFKPDHDKAQQKTATGTRSGQRARIGSVRAQARSSLFRQALEEGRADEGRRRYCDCGRSCKTRTPRLKRSTLMQTSKKTGHLPTLRTCGLTTRHVMRMASPICT